MKQKVLVFVALTFITSAALAQRGVRIGYVDMEYILENVEEYREASEQLENKVQKWKVEIEQKQSEVEQMRKDLMAEKVLLTDELIAEREEEIQILEKEMLEYQQNRFGPQGDLVIQKRLLIQPIQDQVFNEVQKIGANKKYDFIFDKSADVVMLYSEKRHDISELVLRGIARTRRISKPKKKASAKSALEEFEGEPEEEISAALKERQDKAAAAAEARAKTAEERRAEQLRIREERKKAYEARRKKLLEEREARRKAKQEERLKLTEQKKDTIN
ncbi:OmpH family outer membrane protein [Poritiphilus flavus]|uniref:OmpH family outer membrane protein n=1 Tax=Poritiphilus flavus TaxID=2697053 RepID=A0A6L9EGW4_9FLAO|nr:OmpH family outer membrane protein [Poritiphilus flavus]NAS13923.1 OmpH family outer membrane protein [Poritiphilus flavus]